MYLRSILREQSIDLFCSLLRAALVPVGPPVARRVGGRPRLGNQPRSDPLRCRVRGLAAFYRCLIFAIPLIATQSHPPLGNSLHVHGHC